MTTIMTTALVKIGSQLTNLLSYLSNTNDRKVTEEYKNIIYDIVLELSKNFSDEEKPTRHDCDVILHKFYKANEKSQSNEKRKILICALTNSFNPKFYKQGLSTILWDIVEELEYPDFNYLKVIIKNEKNKIPEILNHSKLEFEFAHRLEVKRLVYFAKDDKRAIGTPIYPTELSKHIIEFALETFNGENK